MTSHWAIKRVSFGEMKQRLEYICVALICIQISLIPILYIYYERVQSTTISHKRASIENLLVTMDKKYTALTVALEEQQAKALDSSRRIAMINQEVEKIRQQWQEAEERRSEDVYSLREQIISMKKWLKRNGHIWPTRPKYFLWQKEKRRNFNAKKAPKNSQRNIKSEL